MQSFLSNINRGYFNNEKDAYEEFKTVKNNVKSEKLKDIVKELGFGLFGIFDDDKDKDDKDEDEDDKDGDDKDEDDGDDKDGDDENDEEWDGYEESIGERVKFKNQDKISEEEFKEKYATG